MLRSGFCSLVLIFGLAAPVLAVPVTYQFSGHITETLTSGVSLDGLVSTSSTFTGQFTYDSTNYSLAFPSSTVPYYYHYIDFGANFRMAVTIDDNVDIFDTGAGLTVANNEPITPTWGGDGYYMETTNLRGTPGALPNLWELPLQDQEWWLQFRFFSLSNDVFNSFALPAPLLMDAMAIREIRISAGELTTYGWLDGTGYQITGTIDQISVVPVPAAVWLFGSALAALAAARRRA